MKKLLPVVLVFAVLIYVLPFAGLLLPRDGQAAPSASSGAPQSASSAPAPSQQTAPDPAAQHAEDPLLILDEGSGNVLTVPIRDFVLGAVAAEMPMSYPDEALKAQAVASHSYALAVKAGADPTDASLKGAYFKANPAQRLGFVTDEVMRTMWGDAYEANRARLETLIDSVLTQVLLYDGAPALACYHAISNGKTETAEAVWGTPVPYLVSVDSQLDLTSDGYTAEMTMTAQEFYEAIALNFTGISLEGTPDTWITGLDRSAAGYVTRVHFGAASISGADFRRALALRSTDVTVEYTAEKVFHIITHGYGHGVGLSQYGANALALAGRDYREILAQYYPGTTLGSAV